MIDHSAKVITYPQGGWQRRENLVINMCQFIWTVKLSEPSHPSKQCATVKTHLFAIKTQPHMCPLGSLCREHCHGHRPGRLVLPPRILLFMRAAGRRPQSSEEQMQVGVNRYHRGSTYQRFFEKAGHRTILPVTKLHWTILSMKPSTTSQQYQTHWAIFILPLYQRICSPDILTSSAWTITQAKFGILTSFLSGVTRLPLGRFPGFVSLSFCQLATCLGYFVLSIRTASGKPAQQ